MHSLQLAMRGGEVRPLCGSSERPAFPQMAQGLPSGRACTAPWMMHTTPLPSLGIVLAKWSLLWFQGCPVAAVYRATARPKS